MWCYVKITYYIQIYCITEKIPHDSYLVNDLVSGAWTDSLKIWGCPVKKSWEIKFCFWEFFRVEICCFMCQLFVLKNNFVDITSLFSLYRKTGTSRNFHSLFISGRCSHLISPENTRKLKVFWCLQGVSNGNIDQKCVNLQVHVRFWFTDTARKLSKYGVFSGLYFPVLRIRKLSEINILDGVFITGFIREWVKLNECFYIATVGKSSWVA